VADKQCSRGVAIEVGAGASTQERDLIEGKGRNNYAQMRVGRLAIAAADAPACRPLLLFFSGRSAMRLLLSVFCLLLLAGCSKDNGPLRLDFVGATRYISSNRTGVGPADTLTSRIFATASDASQLLTRLRVTVKYMPRRSPFLYPTPISTLVRDSINLNPDPDFIYLDTLLDTPPTSTSFAFNSLFGVRTTSGTERWQYELLNPDGSVAASRAFQVSVRRADSLLAYHDYTLKLPVPASGNAARRFLQLRAGLALPAYSLVSMDMATNSASQQAAQQNMTDLILLQSGTQLVSPDNTTLLKLDKDRWPVARRRKTRILLTNLTTANYDAATTSDAITSAFTSAPVPIGGDGSATPILAAGQVYAYRADYTSRIYGLIKVISIPTNTATTSTAGLQLQVRTAK
jgi:hypothetical protein